MIADQSLSRNTIRACNKGIAPTEYKKEIDRMIDSD